MYINKNNMEGLAMAKEVKTIGVLTSGGDAPGMNAVLRAATRACLAYGMDVRAIIRGYSGLLKKEYVDFDIRSVSESLTMAVL